MCIYIYTIYNYQLLFTKSLKSTFKYKIQGKYKT